MPRRPRSATTCRLHHVTSRGNNRRSMYEDVDDRERFYGILELAIAGSRVLCHQDVLMGNHFHLVLEGAIDDVSMLMWRLNNRYALSYNRRHGRINHLLGARFHATEIADLRGARAVAVYVALNPVRARFCLEPEDWPFGSYHAHVGGAEPRGHLSTEFVAGLFGPEKTLADQCRAALDAGAGGRPSLNTLLPAADKVTRAHVAQAIRIFGYSHADVARYCGVTPRSLNRWLAA